MMLTVLVAGDFREIPVRRPEFTACPSAVLNLWYTVAALAEGGRPLDAVAKQTSRVGSVALVAPYPCGHGKCCFLCKRMSE